MNIENIEEVQTREAREFYDENGYLIIDTGIPDHILDGAVEFMRADFGEKPSGRKQDAWRRSQWVKQIALNPNILETLVQLYGREPLPFQTLNFMMPTRQPAHSDEQHFSSMPHGLMCGVWVALEDIHPDAGPLVYYPKSHKLPFLSVQSLGLPPRESSLLEYEDAISRLMTHEGFSANRQHGTIKKGQAIIWASNLVHGGSLPLNPALTRMSQVTHYFFKGAEYYYTPILSDVAKGRIVYRDVASVEIK